MVFLKICAKLFAYNGQVVTCIVVAKWRTPATGGVCYPQADSRITPTEKACTPAQLLPAMA